ncbi:MAG TPA: cyclic nucleotide-binding domain-containing protein [Acidimicrobiales bacterium]|nr:cyclic nucleotide-binding domain-containing protein [Acidimicrobiales bacterium]
MKGQLQRHLSGLELFRGCDRRTLRRVTQWGDVIEVGSGDTIVAEDTLNYWFFVVLTGSVRLSRAQRAVATVGPGSHFGEAAIVGFRPQTVTAVATSPAILFVLGARYLLSLAGTSTPFQKALFPEVAPADYPSFVQQMLRDGTLEWRRLSPKRPQARTAPATAARQLPPGRPLSLREAVAVLAPPPGATGGQQPLVPARRPAPRPAWALPAAALVVAVAVVGVGLGYHPPMAVISPGRPIDVTADIRIAGVPTRPVHGRLLLLWVRIRQPNLVGALSALLHGDTTAPAGPPPSADDRARAEVQGRRQYLDSQHLAVRDAAAVLGLDQRRVSVTIRDRGLVGPSAGLVYALAIVEMAGRRDLLGERTVAVTGELEPDGRVDAVGWVGVKAAGALGAGATVMVVPAGEQAEITHGAQVVYPVSSLQQAVADLTRST